MIILTTILIKLDKIYWTSSTWSVVDVGLAPVQLDLYQLYNLHVLVFLKKNDYLSLIVTLRESLPNFACDILLLHSSIVITKFFLFSLRLWTLLSALWPGFFPFVFFAPPPLRFTFSMANTDAVSGLMYSPHRCNYKAFCLFLMQFSPFPLLPPKSSSFMSIFPPSDHPPSPTTIVFCITYISIHIPEGKSVGCRCQTFCWPTCWTWAAASHAWTSCQIYTKVKLKKTGLKNRIHIRLARSGFWKRSDPTGFINLVGFGSGLNTKD